MLGTNTLYGDAYSMTGKAVGGDDSFAHRGFGTVYLYGDAFTLTDSTKGGKDTVDLLAWGGSFVLATPIRYPKPRSAERTA